MNCRNLFRLLIGLVVGMALTVGTGDIAPAKEKKRAGRITVAGGSVGGSSQLWANSVAGIAKKRLNLDGTVLTFPISAMERAAHEGIADVVSGKANQIVDAVNLTGYYAKYKESMTDVRPLYAWMSGSMQVAVLGRSPYKTFRDLVGKRISPGSTAFSPDMYLQVALPLIGLDYKKDFKVVYVASHKEAATALVAGKIDAYFMTGAPPQPTFAELDLVHHIRLIGFSDEDLKTITGKLPFYGSDVIPAKFYHMDKPVSTYGSPALATTTTRMSEDVAYALTKFYIEDPDFVRFYHRGVADDIVRGVQKTFAESLILPVPWHPGAYRYYKEVGWKVPSKMIPK